VLDLEFEIEAVEPVRQAVSPHLVFRLALDQPAERPVRIQNILLHVQIRIDPHLRRYDASTKERLRDLFGQDEQWSRTVHSLLWTHVDTIVLPFSERTVVELAVPCSFDFNLAATRYFDGIEEGDVPLRFLFSGTIFHEGEGGALQVALIPWEREAFHRLPIQIWKRLMNQYYPRSAWLQLGKDVFDRLLQYKRRSGVPTWEGAFAQLLDASESGSAL
jgi:hypothetical protein